MIDALSQVARERWTADSELLALIAQEVHLLWRQQVAFNGGEDPGPLAIARPGDPPTEDRPPSMREVAMRALRGR